MNLFFASCTIAPSSITTFTSTLKPINSQRVNYLLSYIYACPIHQKKNNNTPPNLTYPGSLHLAHAFHIKLRTRFSSLEIGTSFLNTILLFFSCGICKNLYKIILYTLFLVYNNQASKINSHVIKSYKYLIQD